MSSSPRKRPTPRPDERLRHHHVTQFLEMSVASDTEQSYGPVDDVIDRLCRSDGDAWADRAMKQDGSGAINAPATSISNGAAELQAIIDVKDRSKKTVQATADREAFLQAMFRYFIAVAAAGVHHNKRITGRAPQELAPILADLGEVAPEPWAKLLKSAAESVESWSI